MNLYRSCLSVVACAAVVSLSFDGVSFASVASEAFAEKSIEKSYDDAKVAFSQRSTSHPEAIEEALSILSSLENKSDDVDLNYDIYILKSRALYWKGNHAVTNKEKMAIHDSGQAAAEAAKKIDEGYADAYYYAGINLARWGEANGVVASLFKKDELIRYMNDAMNRPTREGQIGESIDGYGPDRTLGRVYFKLPALFGGSQAKSVSYLKKSLEDKTFPVALSVVYYAETLAAGSASDKALAKQMLDELLSQDPTTCNSARVAENLEEFELAKQLRANLG